MFSVRNKSQNQRSYVTSRPEIAHALWSPGSVKRIPEQQNYIPNQYSIKLSQSNNINNSNKNKIQQLQHMCQILVSQKKNLEEIMKKNENEYSRKITQAGLEISRLNCLLNNKNDELQELQSLIQSLSYKNEQLTLKLQTKQTLLYNLKNSQVKENKDLSLLNLGKQQKELKKSRFYDNTSISNAKSKMQKLQMLNQEYQQKLALMATQFHRLTKMKFNQDYLLQLSKKCEGRDTYINSLIQRIYSLQKQVQTLKTQFHNIVNMIS